MTLCTIIKKKIIFQGGVVNSEGQKEQIERQRYTQKKNKETKYIHKFFLIF